MRVVVSNATRRGRLVPLCMLGASLSVLAVTLAALATVQHCARQQHPQPAAGTRAAANANAAAPECSRRCSCTQGQASRAGGGPAEPPATLGLAAARAAAAPGGETEPEVGCLAGPPSRGHPGSSEGGGGIPKILHRIYIADPADPQRGSFTMPMAHEQWIESCQLHYNTRAGWTHMLWDHAAADALIANHYPAFLPFYRHNVTTAIEKSDLARYAVLHKLGGLYFDSDVECWREGSDLLEGWDAVLQGTHFREGVTNAAMAARPGLAVFATALELVQRREVKLKNWVRVLKRTGPELLADALVAVGVPRSEGLFPENVTHAGVAYRIYPAGSFVTPCLWWEQECRRRIYRDRAAGTTDMRSVIGFHRMVGSWIQGKEDGIGILNTTAELCGGANHSGPNGLPGGWVVPESRKRPEGPRMGGAGAKAPG